MDFVEGETLKARLEKTGPLTWAQAKNIFLPAIQAMEQVHKAGLDEIGGEWSDEYYHYGNNGRSSVLELSFEVEDCDSFRFYLEAGGLHGAKVNGKWKIYVRHNGNWEFVQDINYTEPNGYFDIKLDGYKNFDAITACPMVQGNATYSAVFYLQNVHCVL